MILDTNPHAWAVLSPKLPLQSFLASLLVFLNAHLAFNHSNKVAIIASHTDRAVFLYPPTPSHSLSNSGAQNGSHITDRDVEMLDAQKDKGTDTDPSISANQYRPFSLLQNHFLRALASLFDRTTPSSLSPTTSTAGALTLALTYINKQTTLHSSSFSGGVSSLANPPDPSISSSSSSGPPLTSRILLLSLSSPPTAQYIPLMNTIFACQRLSIPIDILNLSSFNTAPLFLQQASDSTGGIYLPCKEPNGVLQYLMMGFLADGTSRRWLVDAKEEGVDFRAACFCHRKVVSIGWVCSVCLSSEFPFLYDVQFETRPCSH